MTQSEKVWALEEALLLVGQEKYLTANPHYYEDLAKAYKILTKMKEELDANTGGV